MIDITKDEFLDDKYEEVTKKEKKENKVKEFIITHKLITVLLILLGIFMIANTILIYNFFKMLETI